MQLCVNVSIMCQRANAGRCAPRSGYFFCRSSSKETNWAFISVYQSLKPFSLINIINQIGVIAENDFLFRVIHVTQKKIAILIVIFSTFLSFFFRENSGS